MMPEDAIMADVSNQAGGNPLLSGNSAGILTRVIPELNPVRSIVAGLNTDDWTLDDFELLETLGLLFANCLRETKKEINK